MNLTWALPEERPKGSSAPQPDEEGSPDRRANVLRVLVLEDEALIAMELESILEQQGHEVVDAVATEADAIAAARLTRPDLVLMDVRLARGGDGVATAIRLRQELGIRSIFITAQSDQVTRARAAAAEPAGFLGKPLSPDLLARLIREAFGS
jgi:DNA-binding NarL/FixJ family response regulator